MVGSFGQRHGIVKASPKTIWDDAPSGFRFAVISLAEEHIIFGQKMAGIIQRCSSKDLGIIGGYHSSKRLHDVVARMDWWEVFDVAEEVYNSLLGPLEFISPAYDFQSKINAYCTKNSIGWRMQGGKFVHVADDDELETLNNAITALENKGHATAKQELIEAVADLSRRPHPDLTGAIQHAGAALECLCRSTTGDEKATLGDLIARNPELFPGSLKKVAEGIWGFASNKGRHVSDSDPATYAEVHLMLTLVSGLSLYLTSSEINNRSE